MDSFKLKNQRVKHILPIGHSQGNLTVVSEVYSVRKSTCHYCGKSPNKPHRKCETFLYNGLDRVDNSVGYIESNVVPCCYICNKMKGDLSTEVFLEHLNNIFTRVL